MESFSGFPHQVPAHSAAYMNPNFAGRFFLRLPDRLYDTGFFFFCQKTLRMYFAHYHLPLAPPPPNLPPPPPNPPPKPPPPPPKPPLDQSDLLPLPRV